MSFRAYWQWLMIGLLCGGLLGCGGGGLPVADDSDGESLEGAEVVLSVQLNGPEGTEFVNMFPDPDAALIEEKVKSLDWENAQNQPHVGLSLAMDGGRNAMRLRGTLGTPNEDGLLRLQWLYSKEGEEKFLQTPPLESLDEAIPVLVAFSQKDEQWRTMVAWEDVEPAVE